MSDILTVTAYQSGYKSGLEKAAEIVRSARPPIKGMDDIDEIIDTTCVKILHELKKEFKHAG